MSNVFLDLGTHFGQGMTHFIHRYRMDNTWLIHTFEANPTTREIFLAEHAQNILVPFASHQCAISNKNGTIILHQETPPNEGPTGMGSSVIDLDKWNPWGGALRENFVSDMEVQAVDLSEIIYNLKDSFEIDKLIIKMDIEGSEFDVLERLIETDTLKYITEIYIEWHEHYFTNSDEMALRKQAIKQAMVDSNVIHYDWH